MSNKNDHCDHYSPAHKSRTQDKTDNEQQTLNNMRSLGDTESFLLTYYRTMN